MGTSNWRLEDVTQAARARPNEFFIPGRDERTSVDVGRLARLHFLLASPGPDEPRAERMWVEVQQRDVVADSVRYSGILTNQPVYIADLDVGDTVQFGPEHIAQLILPSDHPNALAIGEKAALVSTLALEPGAIVRFAYREGADRPEDSGWRMFAGGESDEYANDPKHVRICNVYWLVDRDPTLRTILEAREGEAFERPNAESPWIQVTDWQAPER